MATRSGNEPVGEPTWRVPDIANCRAVRFGLNDDIVYCLRDNARSCGYALAFGRSFLCLHPKRGEIVARTLASPECHEHE